MRTQVLSALFLVLSLPVVAGAAPNGMVVLLTDYGADSIYVGALKGAIYSKFKDAKVDTMTNSVPPFDVATGAYLLLETCDEFPVGTVFCCVVDPGVGTERKCVVLETKDGRYFVAPDNGLLWLVAERYGVAQLRESTNRALWRSGRVSHTFHGRDIFGPVSGALAGGTPLAEVGPELDKLIEIDFGTAVVKEGVVSGRVVRSDPYGNLITNIVADDLAGLDLRLGDSMAVTLGKTSYTAPLVRTYGDVPRGERLILIQSAGQVECAINLGSLAESSGEGLHALVTLRKAE